jgi:two-component system response regulator YesN
MVGRKAGVTALIVDDDIPTVEVIQAGINWELLGVGRVRSAHNITDAKEIILSDKPGLVLCDIEMPNGSGLNLIRWARQMDIGAQFVFLTCHESFQYAVEAMESDAVAYITKPFDVMKTQMALSKAMQRIDRVGGEQSDKARRERRFWNNLLSGMIDRAPNAVQKEIDDERIDIKPETGLTVGLVMMNKSQPQLNLWDGETVCFAMRNLISEIVFGNFDDARCAAYSHGNRYVAVFAAEDGPAELRVKGESLLAAFGKCFDAQAVCCLGERTVLEEAGLSRDRLVTLMTEHLSLAGKVVTVDELKSADTELLHILDREYLRDTLRSGKGLAAIEWMRSKLDSLVASEKLRRKTLHDLLQDYTQIVYAELAAANVEAHILFDNDQAVNLLAKAEDSVFDAIQWISNLTMKSLEAIRQSRESNTIVGKIERYIQDNYMNDITRDDISRFVYLTPHYVSKLFSASRGQTLTDYITAVRLERAKALLSGSAMSVSEIAQAVGIGSFSYFSTLFKKATGLSPIEYRGR